MGRSFVLDSCNNWVHIDENWFYIQIDGRWAWLLQNESKEGDPIAKNKMFIPKIMFLAVVGRPQRRSDGTQFNDLLGISPFVTPKSA